MSCPTYPPLDVLKPVAPNLWIVDSGPLRVLGMPLPVRMTVVRLSNGDVWLHSPTRYDEGLRREIAAIGPIRHLIAPNVGHWTFLAEWQNHCPDALTWAAPELRKRAPVRRSGLRIDGELGNAASSGWSHDLRQRVVQGGFGFREVTFFHEASRTLILTDLIVNLEPRRLSWPMRPLARLAGVTAPDGRAPIYLRLVVRLGGPEAVRAGQDLVARVPERVIFAHGAWFDREATERLRRALGWLLRDAPPA